MSQNWQQLLGQSIKSLEQLRQHYPDASFTGYCDEAAQQFRFKSPAGFLPTTEQPSAALLAQVMPDIKETDVIAGFHTDPVGDMQAMATPGLIHKYAGRALFIVTGACAIHCRYCFRRHYPYTDAQINQENWEPAFNYLRLHTEISEIILSGGDPLMASDEKLSDLILQLESIPHLKRLRIHSRIPSVLPERITDRLIELLTATRLSVSLVTHINHKDEFNETNKIVFQKLRATSIQLLNQSVLLAGVNNDKNSLIDLSETLYENGILPYYLHMLDPVQGAAHFSVKEADAKALLQKITDFLPGYLVPKLVREMAGEKAKTRIL